MSSPSQTPMEENSKYPPQLCWVPRGDVTLVKEKLSKEAKNDPNNPTTSTGEDTMASPNLHQTYRYYFPRTASQADPNASRTSGPASQPSPATNEVPAAATAAFEKLNIAAQESEGEADFETVEKDEAMEDEDDMVVVEATEEEEDYVEL